MTHKPKKAPKASYGSQSGEKKAGIRHVHDPLSATVIPTPGTPRQSAPVATRQETELLDRINIGLSESQARRFQELDSLREQERLTSAELAEFLALADASERMRNDRFEALAELAGLRGESVPSLMTQMGLGLSGG